MSVSVERPFRATRAPEQAAVLQRLSTLDRFLPLWIARRDGGRAGARLARPGLNDGLDRLQVGTVSLPIAAGCC